MKDSDYKVLQTDRLLEGRVFTVDREEVQFPDGRSWVRDVVHHRGAVGIVPLTDEGNVILIEQYRQPARSVILEIPAGALEPGEETGVAALRELHEETGGSCRELVKMSEFYTTPGYSSEYFYLYLATGVTLGKQQLEGDEAIEVLQLPLKEALHKISTGEIRDGKTILGLILAERHLAH